MGASRISPNHHAALQAGPAAFDAGLMQSSRPQHEKGYGLAAGLEGKDFKRVQYKVCARRNANDALGLVTLATRRDLS